ncbi:hypothetical protein AMECASPLE_019067, partial [Ameca splendens]
SLVYVFFAGSLFHNSGHYPRLCLVCHVPAEPADPTVDDSPSLPLFSPCHPSFIAEVLLSRFLWPREPCAHMYARARSRARSSTGRWADAVRTDGASVRINGGTHTRGICYKFISCSFHPGKPALRLGVGRGNSERAGLERLFPPRGELSPSAQLLEDQRAEQPCILTDSDSVCVSEGP